MEIWPSMTPSLNPELEGVTLAYPNLEVDEVISSDGS